MCVKTCGSQDSVGTIPILTQLLTLCFWARATRRAHVQTCV